MYWEHLFLKSWQNVLALSFNLYIPNTIIFVGICTLSNFYKKTFLEHLIKLSAVLLLTEMACHRCEPVCASSATRNQPWRSCIGDI